MNTNTWYKIKNQSLAIYARHAGFDLAVYNKYSKAVKSELRRLSVIEAMRSLEMACLEEHGFLLQGYDGGVYVISLSSPLSLLYPGGRSQVLYIGRGNVYQRIKTHFENKLFDFMQSVSGANFDFHFAIPARPGAGAANYFHQVEYDMLEWFSKKNKGPGEESRYPILNKNAGNDKGFRSSRDQWWKKPLIANGRQPLWQMKPTDFSNFTLLD